MHVNLYKSKNKYHDPYPIPVLYFYADGAISTFTAVKSAGSEAYSAAGNTWYAFHGSAKTETKPIKWWRVGMAVSTTGKLAGPWKRIPDKSPAGFEPYFIENPIVTPCHTGGWLCVYDNLTPDGFGWAWSPDGINWGDILSGKSNVSCGIGKAELELDN